LRWRESLDFDRKMYAAVLVLAGKRMAQRVNASIPDIRIPQQVIDKLDGDPEAGVELACEQIAEIKESGAFDGVHLIPVGKFREVARRLSN
jgi:methylenetetrahydrofolate reductase (NADPH)